MAAKSVLVFIGLLIVATMAAADMGCDTTELIPCLPAAKPNPLSPTDQCCNLIHLLTSDCLCSALESPLAKAEGVDLKTALLLPKKCGRFVPKGTKCGDSTVPTELEHEVEDHGATENGMEHQDVLEHQMEHQHAIGQNMDHTTGNEIGH